MKMELESKTGPIAWMARNSVAANILMIILLAGGWMYTRRVKQEFLPESQLDIVSVSVPYPGAGPEEVEQGIVLALEEAVRGIDGVKKVTATANEGFGSASIEVLPSHDVNQVTDDIRNEINRIRTFPQDSEKPVISAIKFKPPVLDLIVAAEVPETVLREITEQVRDQLLQSKGITQIELQDVRSFEIGIEIPQDRLREYGLSLSDVAGIISRSSVELPGGGLKTSGGEILVRVTDRRDLGREFEQIPIVTAADGTRVLLEDIAEIHDNFDDSDRFTFFNGKPATKMTVFRVGKETPLTVEAAVLNVMDHLEATLPDGIEISMSNNRADMFRGRMGLLRKNGVIGLILVFFVLGLFLEMRLAFWVMLGIPISFLGTFLFMPAFDVSLNMVSMFAFLIALGIVVDDAIVVGENIYHNHQSGMPFLEASIQGAKEIAVPVTFSILTNVVAFLPLYFVPGHMGKFFRVIPMIVCTTFIISLVEALFILPAHLAHQKDKKRASRLHRWQQSFSHKFTRFVKNVYGPFLDKTLRARYVTVSVGLVILIITIGYAKSGRMGWEMFPSVESDIALCAYSLPYGSPVEKTLAVHDRVVAAGNELVKEIEDESGKKLLKGVTATIGRGGGHSGSIVFELVGSDQRLLSTQEFVDAWRTKVGPLSGLKMIRFKNDSGGPGGGGEALTVELSHRNMDVLEAASKDLAESLRAFPMVRDIDDGFTPGKPQIDFSINAEGRSLGLTSSEIARQVRNSYYGSEAIRQQRGRNEIKVKVRLPESERDTEHSLEEMIVRTPGGAEVPLREVVETKRGRAYTSITRRDGRRIITVSADVTPRDQTERILVDVKKYILPELMQKYSGLSFSFEGRQADQRESVGGLVKGLFMALALIFVLLAIPFKSYAQPLIIMVSIPFGIVGAVIGHLLLGYSLSLLSLFGVVALSGVVVNDSLIFIDFANKKRRDGESMHDAIHAAGIQRFRPIVLTTLTTFFGLMPMIFETSLQAKFLIPMAISLGFGILFATGITLLLIPSMTLILEDVGNLFKGKKSLHPFPMSKLLKGSVVAHLARLTLPSIGGLFAIMVFNLTDTWFVSRLGTDELAAMGFTFSVVMMVGALSIGFSSGAASIITRALGAGDRVLARRTVSDGLVLTILVTVLISIAGYYSITPLFSLLGAEGHVLELVREYMQVWFIGAVVAMMPPVSDGCLRADGDMVRPLVVMCICAIINVILDPILIFGWGPFPAMGMRGAAIATIIARTFAMVASLGFLHFHSKLIDWSVPHLRELLRSWKQIIRIGVPAALTQVLNPIAQGFYIRLAAGVGGTQAVAAMATGTRIEAFLFILGIAYGTAIVPFVGHNYGANALHRVQEARRFSNRFAFIYAGATLAILLPSAKFLSGWFSDEPEVVRLSALYLIIATFGHIGVYLINWMSQLLTVIGKPRPVMAINLTRVFLFVMPLSLIGSRFFGFTGLVVGLTLGNLLSGAHAYFTTRRQLQ